MIFFSRGPKPSPKPTPATHMGVDLGPLDTKLADLRRQAVDLGTSVEELRLTADYWRDTAEAFQILYDKLRQTSANQLARLESVERQRDEARAQVRELREQRETQAERVEALEADLARARDDERALRRQLASHRRVCLRHT